MKSAKILISAILIPALLVASDSVQKLIRKPRYGVAQINFADGTRTDGVVSRVTTQFVTLRQGNTCRNVGLAQIASVKWLPMPDDSLGFEYIALMIITSPMWIPLYLLEDRYETSPLDGDWESISMAEDGKISSIEGHYGGRFWQRSVAMQTGRYEVIGQDLHLAYNRSGLVETIPIQFHCDSLVIGDEKLSTQVSTHSAQAPILGRWRSIWQPNSSWNFAASGTFEKRIAGPKIEAQIAKIKGGVRVKWLGTDAKPDEEWGVRTKGHHLFITAGGATTEYIRAAD